jgi:long-chain acyl-CoA synthetase
LHLATELGKDGDAEGGATHLWLLCRGASAMADGTGVDVGGSDSDINPPLHILGLLNIVTAMENDVWMRLHRRFDVDAMLRTIDRDRITIEMAVAPIALAMAAHPTLESYDLSSLRYVVWGATPFAPSVAEIVSRRAGVRWVTAYGASEVPVIACNPLHAPRLDTVGPAVPGVEVRISLRTPERSRRLGKQVKCRFGRIR